MRCSCGHSFNKHPDNGGCQVRVLSGWDDVTRAFTRARDCACDCYEGKLPTPAEIAVDGCPHDYVKGDMGCLYCHKMQVPAR